MMKEKKQPSPKAYHFSGHAMRTIAVLTFILLGIPAFMTVVPMGIIIGIVAVFEWRLGTKYLKMSVTQTDEKLLTLSDTTTHIKIVTNKHEDDIIENHFVAGTSFHKDELLTLAHENIDYNLSKKELEEEYYGTDRIYQYEFFPDKVELVPEPTNEHDPNAIKVIVDGQHIGYIKKGSCSHIHNLIKEDRIKEVDCDIYGGNYKELEFDDYSDKCKLIKKERDFGAKLTLYIKKRYEK